MPNPTWPIPPFPEALLKERFAERDQPNVIESRVTQGLSKVRRRFSGVVEEFDGSLMLTYDQVAEFKSFFHDDCKSGSLPFDWAHPRTDGAATMRFKPNSLGNFIPLGNREGYWTVDFQLEKLP